MMVTNQMMPMAIVNRSRFRSAIVEPPSELDIPPPNMSDSPPPFPLCIRMRRVRKRFARTSRTCSPILTAFTGEGVPSGSFSSFAGACASP